jgi:hypothetical protein
MMFGKKQIPLARAQGKGHQAFFSFSPFARPFFAVPSLLPKAQNRRAWFINAPNTKDPCINNTQTN